MPKNMPSNTHHPSPFESLENNASSRRLRVAILGASGSVGTQALDVVRQHRDAVEVVGLSVHKDAGFAVRAAKEFNPSYICISDKDHARDTCLSELDNSVQVLSGPEGLTELAAMPSADCVLVAIVGAAGIEATRQALLANKRVALANKESLVVAGELLMKLAGHNQILPVDSEHSAVFQCLMGETSTLETLWLTCSGGPFYGCTRKDLELVTPVEALKHPNWAMGPKITIDSATLANKGLEVIEAHHLFHVGYDKIKVLIQPGSTIHSMVTFCDGSTKAQLGSSTMRIPISFAFSYPERWDLTDTALDFYSHAPVAFGRPDTQLFRCLELALEAGQSGGILPAVMNAANEVANAAFRNGRIGFLDIATVIEKTMESVDNEKLIDFDQVYFVDNKARKMAESVVERLDRC